jgi:hypothetical protein
MRLDVAGFALDGFTAPLVESIHLIVSILFP